MADRLVFTSYSCSRRGSSTSRNGSSSQSERVLQDFSNTSVGADDILCFLSYFRSLVETDNSTGNDFQPDEGYHETFEQWVCLIKSYFSHQAGLPVVKTKVLVIAE